MACLTIIGGDRIMACGAPLPMELGRPVGAKLLNASQVASFTIVTNLDGNPVATITRVAETKAVNIEAGNNSLVVNLAMKGGEVYPQQHDVSVEVTFYNHKIANDQSGRAYSGGMNGQYIIAVDHGGGIYKVYGLGAPLEVLSVEGSSTGTGYVRTTLGVEDWQAGTTIYYLTKAAYDALSTPAPAP